MFASCLCQAQLGKTALICAASSGRAECARLLLDAGANKDATDEVRIFCRDCFDCMNIFHGDACA